MLTAFTGSKDPYIIWTKHMGLHSFWFLWHRDFFFLMYFIWRRHFYPLFSSVALWALNPSCGNGCFLLHFTVHHSWKIMVWNATPPPPSSPCTPSTPVHEAQRIDGGTVVGCWRDSLTFNCSLNLWDGFPLRAHLLEHWFSQYPLPSLGHG